MSDETLAARIAALEARVAALEDREADLRAALAASNEAAAGLGGSTIEELKKLGAAVEALIARRRAREERERDRMALTADQKVQAALQHWLDVNEAFLRLTQEIRAELAAGAAARAARPLPG